MKIIKSYTPISEKELEEIENQIGSRFPTDYRYFLMNVNASDIETYYFKGIEIESNFGHFLPQTTEIDLNFLKFNLRLRNAGEEDEEKIGKEYVLVGFDFGNYMYIMSLKPENYGKVYLLGGAYQIDEGKRLIANSFSDLISLLTEYENYETKD